MTAEDAWREIIYVSVNPYRAAKITSLTLASMFRVKRQQNQCSKFRFNHTAPQTLSKSTVIPGDRIFRWNFL